MKTENCINCGKEAGGNFCSHCGQKQGVERLTWANIFGELQKRLFGFDNNFMRTVRDLTLKPKKVISATIEGVRVTYIGPIGYYFLLLTIYILAVSILDLNLSEMSMDFNNSLNPDMDENQKQLSIQTNDFIANNFRLISFIMLPFFVSGLWIVFKNKGYNFLETSVITLYGHGHPIWLHIVFLFIVKFSDYSYPYIFLTSFTYLYMALLAAAFYEGNKLWNFIKAVFAVIIGFLLLILVSMIIGVIIAFLFLR